MRIERETERKGRLNSHDTDCHEGLEIHGDNINTGKFNRFHGTLHQYQESLLHVDIQRRPVASEYHVRKLHTLHEKSLYHFYRTATYKIFDDEILYRQELRVDIYNAMQFLISED